MNFLTSVAKARMAGMTVAAVALPMLSSAALAGPPVHEAAVDAPFIVSTQGNRETTRVAVPYGDLNLASQKGRAALNQRIKRAVAAVCDSPEIRDISRAAAASECRDAAHVDAMAQVALLTASRPIVAAR
jgi:UrcA family protein